MPSAATKSGKAHTSFSVNVKVKVLGPGAILKGIISLVEYACQILSLSLMVQKL